MSTTDGKTPSQLFHRSLTLAVALAAVLALAVAAAAVCAESGTSSADDAATTYTVTYDGNGGTSSAASASVTAGSAADLTVTATVTWENYTFSGWALTDDATAALTSYTPTGDVTLYAVWTVTAYTVTFDANGGTGTVADQTVAVGSAADLTVTGYTRDGCVFSGWALATDATAALTSYTPTGDCTLYAVWIGVTGDCTWSVTGSMQTGGVITLTISGTGAMADYTDTSSAPWGSLVSAVVIGDGVTSIGDYAFMTCSRLASITIPDSVASIGDYAFSSCVSLTSIAIPSGVTGIGDYAFCNCIGLTGSITIPSGVTSIGIGAFTSCTGLTGSITIPSGVTSIGTAAFANCIGLTGIVFMGPQPTIGDGAFSLGTSAAPATVTVTSNGWASSSVFTSSVIGSHTTLTYAVFTYTVTPASSGTGCTVAAVTESETVTYGGDYVFTVTLATGYTACASSVSASYTGTCGTIAASVSGSVVTITIPDITSDGAVTVTGVAIDPVISCIVSYDANGGTGTAVSQTVTAGSAADLTVTGFTRDGYRLAGWALTDDATAALSSYIPTSDCTLYAVWVRLAVVTYDLAGGTSALESQTVDAGTDVVLPTSDDVSRAGYTLTGWTLDAATGVLLGAAVTVSQDMAVHAVWTPVPTASSGSLPSWQVALIVIALLIIALLAVIII